MNQQDSLEADLSAIMSDDAMTPYNLPPPWPMQVVQAATQPQIQHPVPLQVVPTAAQPQMQQQMPLQAVPPAVQPQMPQLQLHGVGTLGTLGVGTPGPQIPDTALAQLIGTQINELHQQYQHGMQVVEQVAHAEHRSAGRASMLETVAEQHHAQIIRQHDNIALTYEALDHHQGIMVNLDQRVASGMQALEQTMQASLQQQAGSIHTAGGITAPNMPRSVSTKLLKQCATPYQPRLHPAQVHRLL